MAKLYKVLPKGFFCLVAVLMVLSALAVPSRDARSDEPIESECEDDTACPLGYVCEDGSCVVAQCGGNPCDQGAPSGCAADCDKSTQCTVKISNSSDLCTNFMCQNPAGKNCDLCACKAVVGELTCVCRNK